MNKGKLIVIDGADGCGKATQTGLLFEKLISLRYAVEKTDFPRYYNNFFGKLIGEFQTSTEFEFSKIHPLLASIPYAADRFESKPQMEKWLNDGKIIISDRYVSANQLHQGGKILDEEKRKEFLERLDFMEHEIFGIPRPDLVILLDVPHAISIKLMKNKDAGKKKEYSSQAIDRVEQDHEYQLNARESGIKMLANDSWKRVSCTDDGETILSAGIIHEKVMEHVLHVVE